MDRKLITIGVLASIISGMLGFLGGREEMRLEIRDAFAEVAERIRSVPIDRHITEPTPTPSPYRPTIRPAHSEVTESWIRFKPLSLDIGQSCKSTSGEWKYMSPGVAIAFIELAVENKSSRTMTYNNTLALIDDKSREFEQSAIQCQVDGEFLQWKSLIPGVPSSGWVFFEVPRDADHLYLALRTERPQNLIQVR